MNRINIFSLSHHSLSSATWTSSFSGWHCLLGWRLVRDRGTNVVGDLLIAAAGQVDEVLAGRGVAISLFVMTEVCCPLVTISLNSVGKLVVRKTVLTQEWTCSSNRSYRAYRTHLTETARAKWAYLTETARAKWTYLSKTTRAKRTGSSKRNRPSALKRSQWPTSSKSKLSNWPSCS